MSWWSPQQFRLTGIEAGVDPATIENAIKAAQAIHRKNPELPPVFTLRHLADICAVDYGFLRAVVSRANENPYRIFRIRKRPSSDGKVSFRVISVPHPQLMKIQRWIAQNILSKTRTHYASKAFSKGDTLLEATIPHCGAAWIIKVDVRNFFESITEISAYHVFRSLGYQSLIAFEMARICTRLGAPTAYRTHAKWLVSFPREVISSYTQFRMGHLPQGAPTSPMLANLSVFSLDEEITEICDEFGLTYTRYADDLVFSTHEKSFDRERCSNLIGEIYQSISKIGLSPNFSKTRILPPGSRKVVLGLLVDTNRPRLTREFRMNLRQHIYYLSSDGHGPAAHASEKGFSSISGLKHHVFGLATFARQIDPDYGHKCLESLREVDWPI